MRNENDPWADEDRSIAIEERYRQIEERDQIERMAEQASVDPNVLAAALRRRRIHDASRAAGDARRLERTHPAA